MKRAKWIIDILSEIVSGHLMGWIVFVLVLVVLVEVVARYFFDSPLRIADEIGAYVVVALTFMGLAYTWKQKGHVKIDFVVIRLNAKARNWLRFITLTIAIAFVLVLIYSTYDLVAYTAKFGMRSETWLRIPLLWPQMVLPLGAVILLSRILVDVIKNIDTLKTTKGTRK